MRSTLPRSLWLLVAFGIATRLVLIAAGGPPERFEYDAIARNLLAGRGYVFDHLGTTYRSFYAGLGYILINTAVDGLFPASQSAMLVAQSLCAVGLALVIFAIARRVMSEGAALAATALVLFHPALVYYDTHKLHPLGFDSLSMIAAVWLLMRVREDHRARAAIAAGVVLGLAMLQRGSMLLFFTFSLAWIAAYLLRRPRGAAAVAAYAAGVLLVVGPWVARNYAIHGIFMLESMTPQQFWKGNATYSEGSGYLPSGRTVYDDAPQRVVNEWEHRDEKGQFLLFREEGLAEVRRDLPRAAGLMIRKFVYFWTFAPQSGQLYPARYFEVYFVYYVLMTLAALVGIAVVLRQPAARPDVALILILFAAVAMVHSLVFVEMRHRWAIEPLMLLFVPAAVQDVARRWSVARRNAGH